LQGAAGGETAPDKQPEPSKRQPKREALPAHLPRVDQRVEPEDTNCPTPECGHPMVRVGEDVSERLDIHPDAVLRIAPDPGQVGLPVLPVDGAGAGRAAGLYVTLPVNSLSNRMNLVLHHPV